MRRNKVKEPMPNTVAVLFLIIGVIMGTVFTFGMQHWEEPIEREDAICVEVTFDSYQERFVRGHTRGIYVDFADYDQQYIDGYCVSDQLRADLEALSPGDKVTILIHPNSSTIWEMRTEEKMLLSFEDSQRLLGWELNGFTVLGILMYVVALWGGGTLLVRGIKAVRE